VSPTVQIGLALALATAFTSILGFLLKHRGAGQAPLIEARRPVRTSLALFRARDYTVGILVATASWGLHVAALSLAPISLVQSAIAGGLVLLTVLADRLFAHRVTRREWVGVALIAAGLAFLAATMSGTGEGAHSDYGAGTLALYAGLLAAAGLAAAALGWGDRRARAPVVGVGAGLLWGASDVSIKALSDSLGSDGVLVLVHPLALAIATLSLIGLTVSARSLQQGAAVPVIAATSAAANLVTIAAGPIVFGEPMPDDAFGFGLRILAFALVIAAASLTPPPGADEGEEVVPSLEPAAEPVATR
jgi:multidrug transporter EmrE-like cation transporter